MKIAVLYSGQIRGNSYKNNIRRLKALLPDADFYFTTWKNQPDLPFIDCYFDEPHVSYNCESNLHKLDLKKLREIKDKYGSIPKDEKARRVLEYKFRKMGRDRIKQHLAHALAYQKYVEGKEYDIVVRVRYDLRYDDDFNANIIDHMLKLCYDEKKPVGIGYLGGYEPGKISLIQPHKFIGDVVIFHRADMFDPQYVFSLANDKKLLSAEFGWFQILCEPYNTNNYTASHSYAWIEVPR
jgi:hypothetical protein